MPSLKVWIWSVQWWSFTQFFDSVFLFQLNNLTNLNFIDNKTLWIKIWCWIKQSVQCQTNCSLDLKSEWATVFNPTNDTKTDFQNLLDLSFAVVVVAGFSVFSASVVDASPVVVAFGVAAGSGGAVAAVAVHTLVTTKSEASQVVCGSLRRFCLKLWLLRLVCDDAFIQMRPRDCSLICIYLNLNYIKVHSKFIKLLSPSEVWIFYPFDGDFSRNYLIQSTISIE